MRATIKLKLAVTFVIIIALLAVVVVVGVSRLTLLNTAITDVIGGPAKQLERAVTIDAELGRLLSDQKDIILSHDIALSQRENQEALTN